MFTPPLLPTGNGARALPAQLLRSIDPVTAIEAAEHPADRALLASLAGRTVTALVVGRADDGHGTIDLGGRRLTIAADLPAPGSQVTLKFAGSQSPPLPVALARMTGVAPGTLLTPADAAGSDADVAVQLGEGARSLGRFAETPLTPLPLGQVQADIEQPGEWAPALARLLRESGTFYESHLAAWSRGRYALEDIRREPQAASATSVHAATLPAPNLANTAALATQADLPVPSRADAGLAVVANAQPAAVPEEHHPVIREQLHALETQTLPVSVETWPGQRADLVIGRDSTEQNGREANDTPGWKSTLKLQLPALGAVTATLSLKGDRLWLDLSASSASAGALDDAAGSLASAMHGAGLRLVRTRIHEEDGDGSA